MNGQRVSPASEDVARSRWGSMRLGNRSIPAMYLAVPAGGFAAAVLGLIVWVTNSGPNRELIALIVGAACFMPGVALAWVTLVDRTTVKGVPTNQEQSVETAWYGRAASGAFTDVVLVTGLVLLAVAATGFELPAVIALSGVLLVAAASFGLRYVAQTRRA